MKNIYVLYDGETNEFLKYTLNPKLIDPYVSANFADLSSDKEIDLRVDQITGKSYDEFNMIVNHNYSMPVKDMDIFLEAYGYEIRRLYTKDKTLSISTTYEMVDELLDYLDSPEIASRWVGAFIHLSNVRIYINDLELRSLIGELGMVYSKQTAEVLLQMGFTQMDSIDNGVVDIIKLLILNGYQTVEEFEGGHKIDRRNEIYGNITE